MSINTLSSPRVSTTDVDESDRKSWNRVSSINSFGPFAVPPSRINHIVSQANAEPLGRYVSWLTGPIAPGVGGLCSLLAILAFYGSNNEAGAIAACFFAVAFFALSALNAVTPDRSVGL